MRILGLLICLMMVSTAFSQDFGGTLSFYQRESGREGKYGLVDSLGNVILPAEYESISFSKDKKHIILRYKTRKIYGMTLEEFWGKNEGEMVPSDDIRTHFSTGVLNVKLDTILPFTAKNIYTKDNYYLIGGWDNFKLLNSNFEEVSDVNFESVKFITQPYSGLWYHTKTGFSGVINKDGNQLMKEMPLWIQPIAENLFVAKVNSKYFFLDKNLKKIHDFSFNKFEILHPEIVLFEVGKQHRESVGLMNMKGKIVLPAEYRQISYNERNEVYLVRDKEYKRGLLNKKFKNTVPFEYDMIKESKDSNLFLVLKDKKYGFVNAKGKVVVPMIYDRADVFSEGLAPVQKDGKWGFINEKGKVIVPMVYDGANVFSEGLAPVKKDEKWGFVNDKGEVVINFQFVGIVRPFENGYAEYLTNYLGSDYETTYIQKDGTFAGEFVRGKLEYFSKEKAILSRYDAKYKYLIDIKTGEVIFRLQ